MKKISGIRVFGLMAFASIVLASCSTLAATGSSPEFRLDLRGLGPWQRHTAAASETLTYSSAWATNAAAGAKAVVKVMPELKTKPKYLVIDLSGGTSATQYPISYLDEVPGGGWSDEYKTSKLVLCHIPAGSFIMGGRATDYPGAGNTNLHMVTITRDFYMGVFEVTQRQWELVMGTRPSSFTNATCYAKRPVESVRYIDIRGARDGAQWPKGSSVDVDSFMGVVRRKTGMGGFDLPTESQWEYACRAGTSTALNSGKDLSSCGSAPEMNEVGRYSWNSGLAENPKWREELANGTTEVGTANVGSYTPNSFGCYDMHGNAWEWCLDRVIGIVEGSVDPVGDSDGTNTKRGIKGGPAEVCISGVHYSDVHGFGYVQDGKYWTLGFRLCLQGGELPDFDSASTLINAANSGTVNWTPTKSTTYYLTHETTNGASNAQLLSAWFVVPGCQLTLEPQGELTNGVSVAITGAGEGWTVYYTTNGLAPSQASEKYTGPFSLPESATVRAVAYNAQGVASEEVMAAFTLHDALSVIGAVARPRYPWNGMVDVDCEIMGDPEAKYDVELVVKDLEGGTNLPVRTVYVDATSSLAPGRHRLTWNADADIAHDHDFPRVAVTVKATKQSVLAGYSRQFVISTDGYAGEETLVDVPVLARLSTAIDGFDYCDFASPSNGADLAFFDANEQTLPYEIDEWHTNGESLVWVKLPTLKRGTRFTCAYGNNSKLSTPNSQLSAQHEVWAGYAGVWHMNEDSGTAFDSTEHGLDALPNCRKDGDVGQMVPNENGACGRARVNQTQSLTFGNFMEVPSYDSLALGGSFTIGGWFKANAAAGERAMSLFNRKTAWNAENGYEALLVAGTATNILCRGKSTQTASIYTPDLSEDWVSLTFEYKENWVKCYANGVLVKSASIWAATDNGKSLLFGGCLLSGDRDTFNGQYDEIRLRGGSLSADRIKADYDMIANRAFCTYGAVKKGAGD